MSLPLIFRLKLENRRREYIMALKDEILEKLAEKNIPVPNDAIDQQWFIDSILEAHAMGYAECEDDNF